MDWCIFEAWSRQFWEQLTRLAIPRDPSHSAALRTGWARAKY
ncbi:hypothetical protein VFA_002021 [Vibrio furnissii CIP 102972]|nr:hypothetical protein VFA_002021 [Vibrio furnissii CIP 102972]